MNKILKPYILGETAYNHEGDIKYLYRMIDDIAEMGLNAVKFHIMFDMNSYMTDRHPLKTTMAKWLFSEKQWDEIIDHSHAKKLDVIQLCDDVESIQYLNRRKQGIYAIEIHAVSLNDWHMLSEAAKFKGKVILSIGGAGIDEIDFAVDFLRSHGKNDIILMYGFQSYPTNYEEINLLKMQKLRDLFGVEVGYADHTAFNDPNNEFVSVMAAQAGFNILEKHYTPDHGKERIDYHAAASKEQLLRIKALMELALKVYGTGDLKMSKPEQATASLGAMKKVIVAKKAIKKGEKLSADNLWFKRTPEGSHIKQNQFLQLIGLEADTDIEKDQVIDFNDLKSQVKKTDVTSFTRVSLQKAK